MSLDDYFYNMGTDRELVFDEVEKSLLDDARVQIQESLQRCVEEISGERTRGRAVLRVDGPVRMDDGSIIIGFEVLQWALTSENGPEARYFVPDLLVNNGEWRSNTEFEDTDRQKADRKSYEVFMNEPVRIILRVFGEDAQSRVTMQCSENALKEAVSRLYSSTRESMCVEELPFSSLTNLIRDQIYGVVIPREVRAQLEESQENLSERDVEEKIKDLCLSGMVQLVGLDVLEQFSPYTGLEHPDFYEARGRGNYVVRAFFESPTSIGGLDGGESEITLKAATCILSHDASKLVNIRTLSFHELGSPENYDDLIRVFTVSELSEGLRILSNVYRHRDRRLEKESAAEAIRNVAMDRIWRELKREMRGELTKERGMSDEAEVSYHCNELKKKNKISIKGLESPQAVKSGLESNDGLSYIAEPESGIFLLEMLVKRPTNLIDGTCRDEGVSRYIFTVTLDDGGCVALDLKESEFEPHERTSKERLKRRR